MQGGGGETRTEDCFLVVKKKPSDGVSCVYGCSIGLHVALLDKDNVLLHVLLAWLVE